MQTDTSPPSVMPPAARIGSWTGEFCDVALERAFRRDTQERVVQQQRISMLVWAGILLLFAVPDYFSMGLVPGFWILAAYRVGMAVLLLAGRHAMRRDPAHALEGRLLMWLGMLGFPLFFLMYEMRPEVRPIITSVIVGIQLSLFLFLPVRVKATLPLAIWGAIGTTVSVWLLDVGALVTLVTLLFVTMPIVIGYVVALRLQKIERQEFWMRRQLEEINLELQSEVARRVHLQIELERQAATDSLTGLPNRRAFSDRFPLESARSLRTGEALSLGMFDLDFFKRINDTYGHAAGDAVLRNVGHICSTSFRGVDLAARIGGEEFAVLLPGANADQATMVMERFARALASMDMAIGSQTIRITATAGVAQQKQGETLDGLMVRADAALYAGKQAGRNRVVRAT